MNITGGQGCSGINYSNAVHTPMAFNLISYGQGSYVGGMQSGNSECPNCYLSEENDQAIAITSSVQYTFNWEGGVNCTFGGNIFGMGGGSLITISTTYGLNSLGNQVVGDTKFCGYTPNCSSGTPTCGSPSWTTTIPSSNSCASYIKNVWGSVVVDGFRVCGGRWSVATGEGPCN